MLLVLRCFVFIGVCVEFVAAVAWLAELFPEPERREKVLGYTQAFSSLGGILVATANGLCVAYVDELPGDCRVWPRHSRSARPVALHADVGRAPGHSADPDPAVPAGIPGVAAEEGRGHAGAPEPSPRCSRPTLRRTTIVTTIMLACAYGAAFGAIQQIQQIVPGLAGSAQHDAGIAAAASGARHAGSCRQRHQGAGDGRAGRTCRARVSGGGASSAAASSFEFSRFRA